MKRGGMKTMTWNLPSCVTCCVIFLLLLCFCDAYRSSDRYKYMSYGEINRGMLSLAKRYPHLLHVYSANRHFHLPPAGLCRAENSVRQSSPCEVFVAEVGTRPTETTRPQVLIVGSIHGDERLGAQVAFHLIKLMVVQFKSDPWIQRLLKTRRVTIVPVPNPFGYDRSMRYEEINGELIDPNTDFPFDQNQPQNCMKSISARVINELFRANQFRIAVVFHAKKQPFIGYSWGGRARCRHRSEVNSTETMNTADDEDPCVDGWDTPDELAMRQLAQHMSTFAGELEGGYYKVGSLNDPVLDSTFSTTMVDWAYAASFTQNSTICRPGTYGGYPASKTVYNNSTNRCITYVVETSRDSSPLERELGEPRGLYKQRNEHGNGHIPRNLRLSLMAIDIANPYIFFLSTPGAKVDIARGGIMRLKWSVGGAFHVQETYLEFEIDKTKETFTTAPQSGGSMWAQNHGIDGYEKRFHVTEGIFYGLVRGSNVKWAYSEAVRLLKYVPASVQKTGSDMRIRAVAKVDQSWVEPVMKASENGTLMDNPIFPQSHLAQSRSEPNWASAPTTGTRRVGYVYSEVITVRLPPKTLRNSFYGYVLEMVFFALLFCALPPLAIVIFLKKTPGGYVQANLRRAMRAFSVKDISEEIARLRDQRKPGKPELRRQI